jgi:hypothetical protein
MSVDEGQQTNKARKKPYFFLSSISRAFWQLYKMGEMDSLVRSDHQSNRRTHTKTLLEWWNVLGAWPAAERVEAILLVIFREMPLLADFSTVLLVIESGQAPDTNTKTRKEKKQEKS